MSIYMTEAEQVEAIKAWWQRHQRVITTLITGVLLLVAGYRYWHWHTEKVTHLASEAYERLMMAASHKEGPQIEAYAHALIKEYPKTVYRDAARLTLAKHFVSEKKWDAASQELEAVVKHARMPALKEVAQIRLIRLWIAEKAYDKALTALNKMNSATYKPLIDELKGDVYAATQHFDEAEASYQEAREEIKIRGIGNVFLDMKSNELASLTGDVLTT